MDNQGILDLETKRLQGLVDGDPRALEAHLDNGLVYIHTNGICDTKQSLIKSIADGVRKYTRLSPRRSDVRRFGDVFIITGEMDIAYIARGAANDAVIMFTAVWHADAQTARLISWQSSPSTFRP